MIAVLSAALLFASGCGMMDNSKKVDRSADVKDVDMARQEAKALSSEIFDAIGLKGQTSATWPGVLRCEEDSRHLYKIHHPWSVWGVPEEDMERSMEQLKEALPKRGWKLVSYGRDKSLAQNLELVADSAKSKFSVNITFMDKRRSAQYDSPKASKESGILVTVVSACFRVPDGKVVDQY
ncbi:hypothetical protein [Streptomyces sp. NPDC001678]|uniref:hypothetical protein n=1 Tax=Streptomyces sp. NPDC001678 TaxID=3364599 RepID=UPI0036B166F0